MATETRPTITEVNCETGEVTVRPMDEAEYQSYLNVQKDNGLTNE
jgi:hypothetical protein